MSTRQLSMQESKRSAPSLLAMEINVVQTRIRALLISSTKDFVVIDAERNTSDMVNLL